MALDLRAIFGGGGGKQIAIGQNIRWPIDPASQPNGIFVRDGMTLVCRNVQRDILASEYPTFYAYTEGYYVNPLYVERTPTGQTTVRCLESKANGVVMVVGSGGRLSRSTNGGTTWTDTVLSTTPAAADLLCIHHNATLNKWFIFYADNRIMMSVDDGLNWTNTVVTGFTAFTSGSTDRTDTIRCQSIGNTMVFTTRVSSFTCVDGGGTWINNNLSSVMSGHAGGGKMTTGNGYWVIIDHTGKMVYSANGTAWTTGRTFTWSDGEGDNAGNYGAVFDGTRWYVGEGGPSYPAMDTGYPIGGPPPGEGVISLPTAAGNVFSYTSGGSPGVGWTSVNVTIGGGYATSWSSQGGQTTWWTQAGSRRLYIGASVPGLGVYAKRTQGSTTNPSEAVDLYQAGILDHWRVLSQTNPNNIWYGTGPISDSIPGAGLNVTGGGSRISGGVTAANMVWSTVGVNAGRVKTNVASTVSARILPQIGNLGTDETYYGPLCTRIK